MQGRRKSHQSSLYARWSLVIAATLSLSACISYKSETEAVSYNAPDKSVLNAIQLGETTTEWLIDQLGQPNAVRRPSDDIHIWQYENVSRSVKEVKALPLFAVEVKNQQRTVFNFEVENERVVKFWKETVE